MNALQAELETYRCCLGHCDEILREQRRVQPKNASPRASFGRLSLCVDGMVPVLSHEQRDEG